MLLSGFSSAWCIYHCRSSHRWLAPRENMPSLCSSSSCQLCCRYSRFSSALWSGFGGLNAGCAVSRERGQLMKGVMANAFHQMMAGQPAIGWSRRYLARRRACESMSVPGVRQRGGAGQWGQCCRGPGPRVSHVLGDHCINTTGFHQSVSRA